MALAVDLANDKCSLRYIYKELKWAWSDGNDGLQLVFEPVTLFTTGRCRWFRH